MEQHASGDDYRDSGHGVLAKRGGVGTSRFSNSNIEYGTMVLLINNYIMV